MSDKPELPKAYDPAAHEDAIYKLWEESGFFDPGKLPGERKEPFSIVMPPPNVTGILHLGHALENALMDTMARYERMRGKRVLLVPGTDHAAIATQAKVEKLLMAKGVSDPRGELSREGLVEKIREFAEESKATILGQVRKMGTSCDWSRLAYTFDAERSAAVNELFKRMYDDGLIYRGYRVVNWSVKGQSTCSDDEIVHVERPAKLYTFKYAKDFPISISTTRPETKLGDTAVAVHPSDERYASFVGKTYKVDVGAAAPLEIRIITDEEVDPAFGTGALGVTPAHSAIDFAMYEKQKAKGEPIGIVPVIGVDGRMTVEAGTDYAGLTAEAAREKFVAWLRDLDLLSDEQEISQNVGTSDRWGDVIEAIPMTQWWLDMNKTIPSRGRTLRELMREAVTTGLGGDASKKVTVTPERFTKLYLDRVDNLRDWCLSRQLWWGHRIPVWYRGEEVRVSETSPGAGWEQDPDTLDTWFSSGSWTFSTLGWPERTADLAAFHPTSWIQMGYEILYLWLMRMILMSAYALDQVPFKDAYIHGILRDQYGKKFSKSSGNGIDPIEVIGQYGCDALRISLLIGISPGNDSRYYTEKIEGGRNFVNKLWNIGRYVLATTRASSQLPVASGVEAKTLPDRWILARLAATVSEVTAHIEAYEYSQAGEKLRDFTWGDFADWYLEISKVQKAQSPELAASTDAILRHVLLTVLKLWHPFMPFVTEVLWRETFGDKAMLMVETWPTADQVSTSGEMDALKAIVAAIRDLRTNYKIPPKQETEAWVATPPPGLESELAWVSRLSSSKITLGAPKQTDGLSSAVVGETGIFVDIAGKVDATAERERLTKEAINLEKYVTSVDAKLANEEFVGKAPTAVIEKERGKRDAAAAELDKIRAQLELIQ